MMKSTQQTREALRHRLASAYMKNPDNQELKEAFDIVDDMVRYHSELVNTSAVYVLRSNDRVYFYRTSDMKLLRRYTLTEQFMYDDAALCEILRRYI